MNIEFSIIAAIDKNFGIGRENKLPWHLKGDLEHFSKITTGFGNNAVIMGRSTWESLPTKNRPLPKRLNIILSRSGNIKLRREALRADSLDDAFKKARERGCDDIFVIGGAQVYKEAISHPACSAIHLTEIDAVFDCDAFFPAIDTEIYEEKSRSKKITEHGVSFSFITLNRPVILKD